MNIIEAVAKMREGKRVTLPDWGRMHLFVHGKGDNAHIKVRGTFGTEYDWEPIVGEISRTDWEIVE